MLKPHSKVLQQNGLEIEYCPVENLGNQNGISETLSAGLYMFLLTRKAIVFLGEYYSVSDPVPSLYQSIFNFYKIQNRTMTKI